MAIRTIVSVLLLINFACAVDSVPLLPFNPDSEVVLEPLKETEEHHVNGQIYDYTFPTRGWKFFNTVPLTVTHVAVYDEGLDGLAVDHRITLHAPGGVRVLGDELLDITIPAGTPGEIVNGWRRVEIPPLVIDRGTYYLSEPHDLESPDRAKLVGANLRLVPTDPRIWSASIQGCPDTSLLACFLVQSAIVGPMLFVEPGGTYGDFDRSGKLDVEDLNRLTLLLQGVFPEGHLDRREFDVDRDTFVDQNDRNIWIIELKRTYFGDSNLDGEFNSTDLIQVFQASQYEDDLIGNSQWAEGDWNGDSDFDSSDLVSAFKSEGYEIGPRPAVMSIPEPEYVRVLLWVTLGYAWSFRRERKRSGSSDRFHNCRSQRPL